MARRRKGTRGRTSAAAHVSRVQVGTRDDIVPARDCKHAERIGGKARIGDGLTVADIDASGRMRERAKNGTAGRVDWRAARQVRAVDALLGASVPVPVAPSPDDRTHAPVVTVTPAPREREERTATRDDLYRQAFRVLCVEYGFAAIVAAMSTVNTTESE